MNLYEAKNQKCFSYVSVKMASYYAQILEPLLQNSYSFQQIIKVQGLAMYKMLLQFLIILPPCRQT